MNRIKLRAWRNAHGLTQTELGQLLGVDKMTVYRWESGQTEYPAFLELALERLDDTLPRLRQVS